MSDATVKIEHQTQDDKGRFVLFEGEANAGKMTYIQHDNKTFTIDHTIVDEAFGGKGYARKLVQAGVAYARESGQKIIPVCSYAKHVLTSDAAYADVLAKPAAD